MCTDEQPRESPATPDAQTFTTIGDFLNAIEPGMDLCTSDFTGWADIESVRPPTGGSDGILIARVRETGVIVHVPTSTLVDIRGGHCVRLDRVRATVNDQGWEVPDPTR